MRRYMMALMVTVLPWVVGGNAWGGVRYTVTDLGDLPGGNDKSSANDINNLGHVVGRSDVAGTSNAFRAFLWTPQIGMQMLGGLPSEPYYSTAEGINDLGQVVGYVRFGSGSNHAYLWNSVSSSQDLSASGTLGAESGAYDVNNAGQIVGYTHDTMKYRAVLVSPSGSVQQLGALGNYNSANSRAQAINSTGQVVGFADVATNVDHAFAWTASQGIQDLGGGVPQSTADFYAYDVNDNGWAVGYSVGTTGTYKACLWTSPGNIQYFDDLPNGMSARQALGINSQGAVVGWANSGGIGRALLWSQATGTCDLNEWLDASGTGWTLTTASAINDRGQIVGTGTNPQGRQHAYLLTPIPEPSTLALLATTILALGLAWFRKRRAA